MFFMCSIRTLRRLSWSELTATATPIFRLKSNSLVLSSDDVRGTVVTCYQYASSPRTHTGCFKEGAYRGRWKMKDWEMTDEIVRLAKRKDRAKSTFHRCQCRRGNRITDVIIAIHHLLTDSN